MSERTVSTPTATHGVTLAFAAPVLVGAALIGIVAAQGGYFPTSWGWSAITSLWALAIWLVVSARTDASRLDAIFIGGLGLVVAWIGLSVVWSANPPMSVLELERALVLLGGCAAFLALAHRAVARRLTLAVLFAITVIACYGLATRLFPLRFGLYQAAGIYRLSEPIGYWNGLGIFTVLGILLALGYVAATSAPTVARLIAAVALLILPVTLYFTFSRGSWVSLGFGYGVTLAVSTRRLRLLAATAMVAPGPLIGVLVASRSRALTHAHASLATAVHDGRRVAVVLVVLTALTVGCVFLFITLAGRVSVSERVGRAATVSIVTLGVVLVVAGLVRVGGPVEAATRGYHSFVGAPPSDRADLNARLFNLSSNGRGEYWLYAWHIYRAHPLLGSGAGTFERAWQKNPAAVQKVRDAHGLYIETLAELGPLGLVALVLTLAVPVVAGVRTRRYELVPATLGGYSAFLLHAGADWDWELAGVTLTALVIGSLLLVHARRDDRRTLGRHTRYAFGTTAVALSCAAGVGLLGNIPLARSTSDTSSDRYARALTEAIQARRWEPWSPQPWIARGEAQLGLGADAAAAASFRKALSIDDREWRSWLDLALATRGRTRTDALARAKQLYPNSAEIADAVAHLASANQR